jgi:hypothetical protein
MERLTTPQQKHISRLTAAHRINHNLASSTSWRRPDLYTVVSDGELSHGLASAYE